MKSNLNTRKDLILILEKKVLESICVISYDNKKLFTDSENDTIQNIIKSVIELQKSLSEKKQY
jgi:hypothetical protein